jgi:hypothetical protein
MKESTQEKELENAVSKRLIEALKSIGYDVQNKKDVPRLSKTLEYSRAQNIYNAISGDREPGLKLLSDLANKFENFDLVYVISGKRKIKGDAAEKTDSAEGEEQQPATLGNVADMYEDLKDYLITMQSNLLNAETETSSLVQAVLVNQARHLEVGQPIESNLAHQHFEKSLKLARKIWNEVYDNSESKTSVLNM